MYKIIIDNIEVAQLNDIYELVEFLNSVKTYNKEVKIQRVDKVKVLKRRR